MCRSQGAGCSGALFCGIRFISPCAGHIPPAQQFIALACKAAAHNGDQSSTAASKHTHAPNFFPGAIGDDEEGFMCRSGLYNSQARCRQSVIDAMASKAGRELSLGTGNQLTAN